MNPARYCKECGCYVPDNNDKCLACGYDMNLPTLPTCESRIYSPTESFMNTPYKAGTVVFYSSSDTIFYNTGAGCGWMRIQ